ncbi:hypothetical protein MRX96_021883 [Rhipicephalus microplus]
MDICGVIGDYGKFQKNIFWFGLVRGTFMGLHLVVSSFFVPEIDHWCAADATSEVSGSTTTSESRRSSWSLSSETRHLVEQGDFGRSTCSIPLTTTLAARGDNLSFVSEVVTTVISCGRWNYGNSFAGHTLVQEWDLVCERAWMRSLVQSSFMTGMLIGCLLCSALGDRLGRRPLLVSSCALVNMAGLATAAAPSFGVFLAARVFLGISLAVMQTTSFCLLVEVTGPRQRTRAAIAFTLGFALSLFVLPGTVWLIQHWRYIQVAITMPFVAIAVWSWYLPESPRWLIATGRTEEATSVVLRAASANGIEIQDVDSALRQLQKKILQENEDAEKVHFLDLVREPRIRRYSVILVYSCVSCGAAFYGIQLSMTRLGGNPYVGFLLSGLGRVCGRGPLLRHRALVPQTHGCAGHVCRGGAVHARFGLYPSISDVAPPSGRPGGQDPVRRGVHRHLAVRGRGVPHRTAYSGSRRLSHEHPGWIGARAATAGNEALHERVGAHGCSGGHVRPGRSPGPSAARDVPRWRFRTQCEKPCISRRPGTPGKTLWAVPVRRVDGGCGVAGLSLLPLRQLPSNVT